MLGHCRMHRSCWKPSWIFQVIIPHVEHLPKQVCHVATQTPMETAGQGGNVWEQVTRDGAGGEGGYARWNVPQLPFHYTTQRDCLNSHNPPKAAFVASHPTAATPPAGMVGLHPAAIWPALAPGSRSDTLSQPLLPPWPTAPPVSWGWAYPCTQRGTAGLSQIPSFSTLNSKKLLKPHKTLARSEGAQTWEAEAGPGGGWCCVKGRTGSGT